LIAARSRDAGRAPFDPEAESRDIATNGGRLEWL
jgi:hypothetical protein